MTKNNRKQAKTSTRVERVQNSQGKSMLRLEICLIWSLEEVSWDCHFQSSKFQKLSYMVLWRMRLKNDTFGPLRIRKYIISPWIIFWKKYRFGPWYFIFYTIGPWILLKPNLSYNFKSIWYMVHIPNQSPPSPPHSNHPYQTRAQEIYPVKILNTWSN